MNFIMNKTKCLDEESNNRVAKMDNPAWSTTGWSLGESIQSASFISEPKKF